MSDVPFEGLEAKDVPAIEFNAPDHTASRPRPRLLRKDAKSNESKPPLRKATVPRSKPGQFVEPLTKIYAGIGLALMPFDQVCAVQVANSATTCAEAWDELAQKNDAVRKMLYAITETSAWGGVMIAHFPILMAVAGHHMPGIKLPGATIPDTVPTEWEQGKDAE